MQINEEVGQTLFCASVICNAIWKRHNLNLSRKHSPDSQQRTYKKSSRSTYGDSLSKSKNIALILMDEQVKELEYTTKNKKVLLLHDRLNNTVYSVVTRFTLHFNDMKGKKKRQKGHSRT